MAIADLFNRVFKPRAKDLTEPQAEGGITGVRNAWAESVATGLTPARLAAILADCDRGEIEAAMTLAEEMEERDPHYAAVLGQRKRAISGIAPTVKPASESPRDIEIADAVRTWIAEHEGFPALVESILDSIGKGFSVVEIDWRTNRVNWAPGDFIARPQRYFQPDRETGREIRLRDEADPVNGLPLRDHRFITHVSNLKSGQYFRGGLARVAAFSWLCKAYTLKDWISFVELYGLPLRLGRYGPGASEKDIATLFRAVANIGTDAAAVVPKFMDIEFVDTKGGTGEQPIFENLARYMDQQISKVGLGQTMTTDDGASMAQAKVHNDVRLDIAQADARSVTAAINRDLVAPFVRFNFGEATPLPRLMIEVEEPEDTETLVRNVTALAAAGVRFNAAEARRRVGMFDPGDDDEVFGGAAAGPPALARAAGRAAVAAAREDAPEDDMDAIRDEMLADWEPAMTETLDPVRRAIAEAESYEDALERLAELDGLPVSRLIEALVKGTFKARATGDAEDG